MSFWNFLAHEWFWVSLLVSLVLVLIVIEWIENGHGLEVLSLQQAIRFLNDKKHAVLDLRPQNEFVQGFVQHSKHVEIKMLLGQPEQFIKKKDTPVLLLCEHNHKARSVGRKLKQLGYLNIALLKGGISHWRKENLPLSTSAPDKKEA